MQKKRKKEDEKKRVDERRKGTREGEEKTSQLQGRENKLHRIRNTEPFVACREPKDRKQKQEGKKSSKVMQNNHTYTRDRE